MNRIVQLGGFSAVILMMLLSPVQAGVVSIFTGSDPGVGPGGAHPISQSAADSFAAAAGASLTRHVDFENMSIGTGVPLSFLGGSLTASNAGTSSLVAQVQNSGSSALGFNTTAGGANFFQINQDNATQPTLITFNFAQPVWGFGAYISGLGTSIGSLRVWFDDGQLQNIPVSGNPTGGVLFFGFLSDSKTNAVNLQLDTVGGFVDDGIGVDDVVFTATPEPGTFGLLGAAAAGLGLFRRVRR